MPSMFRKIEGVRYERERLELPDGDFLDLDWIKNNNDQLVILSHGLEGSSDRHYVKGMAGYFAQHHWDALAWNCRSCSGEMNRLPRFYHHGDAQDLRAVIDHAIKKGKYSRLVVIGFSMGGSMTLRYLGENPSAVPGEVKGSVTFSVPCDLASSVNELNKSSRRFYRERFLKKLGKKIESKSKLFPEVISHDGFNQIKTFRAFDTRYTAPLHHFKDADDFYVRGSCKPFLAAIKIPSLLVNAANDPFLTEDCYPKEIAAAHPFLYLEIPKQGGHVGFSLSRSKTNWMEWRSWQFVNQIINRS
ncbi:MAG: alpha/beta hydrolase [Azospira oryzae]|nr:MAG: alpha/beta hydrolase [Azospira oryzae]